MASIGTLVLDIEVNDAGFTAKLKSAEGAIQGVEQAAKKGKEGMDSFGGASETLQRKMELLTTTLLGAGFLEFGRKALELGDRVSDLSAATDVSIPKILQLREAFEASGGSADGLNKVISKLSQTLQDARDGSQAAQENLLKLGFSFKDMANMDTEQAMAKTIDKLASMDDVVQRNALAFRVFGREAKTIDWEGVKAGTSNSTAEFEKFSESLKKANEAHDKLAAASEKLLIAFTDLLEKSGILDGIKSMGDNMDKFQKIVVLAGIAFATYFGAKAVTMALEFGTALLEIRKGIMAIFAAEQMLEKGTVIGRIASIVVGAAAAIGAIVGADWLSGKIVENMNEKSPEAPKPPKPPGTGTGNKPAVTAYYSKEIEAIKNLSKEYEYSNNLVIKKLELDGLMIGRGEDVKAMANALADAENKHAEAIKSINQKIAEENANASGGDAGKKARVAALEKEKEKIDQVWAADKVRIENTIKGNQTLANTERIRTQMLDEQFKMDQKLDELKGARSKMGQGSTEQTLKDIELQEMATARQQIFNEEKRRGLDANGQQIKLTEDEKNVYINAADERIKKLQEETSINISESRKFSTGWKQAFNDYIDNATNAANQARDMFNAVTGSMNSAIDKFVETGKFSFGDFAQSVIMDLEKIALKAAAAQVFKSMTGTGGLFAGLFAGGGDIPAGKFGLVGEAGPELVQGPATVTSAKDTAAMGGGGTTIINNISALDSRSVAQLFAENRMTLFGTVEQARRELPMRTR